MALDREFYFARICRRLGELGYQLQMRGKRQLYDLHKHSENFSKRLLNEIWNINLENLNKVRSNEPGIDLGDKVKGIAVQVTSEKKTAKIKATLEQVIKEEHNKTYKRIIILILGEKQPSGYTLAEDLVTKTNFNTDTDIIDIADLTKIIDDLDPPQMKRVWDLIKSEMSGIYDELDISQHQLLGIPSLEDKQEITYTNCVGLLAHQNAKHGIEVTSEEEEVMDKDFIQLLSELRDIPLVTRKFFCRLCESVNFNKLQSDSISLSYQESLRKIKGITAVQFDYELSILIKHNLIRIGDEDEKDQSIEFYGPSIKSASVYNIIDFCLAYNINMADPLVNLDFSSFAR